MRTAIIFCFVLLMAAGSVSLAGDYDRHTRHYDMRDGRGWHLGHLDFDIDDGTIILESTRRRSRDVVEITPEYDLYINGDQIPLTNEQQELVEDYYEQAFDIVDQAKRIGIEGAKIGAEGAKIGLNAIGGIFKMIFTSYDEDDFEEDIEAQAEELEIKAEKLEEWAEEIEDMADDLEDTFDEMMDEIPELDELDW